MADEGIVEVRAGEIPPPLDPETMHCWARFPFGAAYVLESADLPCGKGYDCVLFGNIPGGGMSRSASLSINLLLTMMEVNGLGIAQLRDEFQMIELAQQIENEYIGSPCGQLDQIMIYFAKAGMGTHFNPKTKKVSYVPLGASARPFAIMALDTGTNRPGLDKSTYKVRKQECDLFATMLEQGGYGVTCLGDVRDDGKYEEIARDFGASHPHLVDRLTYIYTAQQNFYRMMAAWKAGDVEAVGAIFREDGNGLRDEYVARSHRAPASALAPVPLCASRALSHTGARTCTTTTTIPFTAQVQHLGPRAADNVRHRALRPRRMGERMLGGGDKGASGCIVALEAASTVIDTVAHAYPLSRPHLADEYAVHGPLQICDGVLVLEGLL